MKRFIFFSFLLIFFTACKKAEMVHIENTCPEFDTLVLADVFDVDLIQGNQNRIAIEAYETFANKVRWKVKNNTLSLYNDNKNRWLKPSTNKVKLIITVNNLSKIVANETCSINSRNPLNGNEIGLVLKSKLNHANLMLNCQKFYYWNNFPCGGTLALSGNCHELKLWNYALMQVDATHLNASVVRALNASKGSILTSCTDSLYYQIEGSGNIEVYGNPTFVNELAGGGIGNLILH